MTSTTLEQNDAGLAIFDEAPQPFIPDTNVAAVAAPVPNVSSELLADNKWTAVVYNREVPGSLSLGRQQYPRAYKKMQDLFGSIATVTYNPGPLHLHRDVRETTSSVYRDKRKTFAPVDMARYEVAEQQKGVWRNFDITRTERKGRGEDGGRAMEYTTVTMRQKAPKSELIPKAILPTKNHPVSRPLAPVLVEPEKRGWLARTARQVTGVFKRKSSGEAGAVDSAAPQAERDQQIGREVATRVGIALGVTAMAVTFVYGGFLGVRSVEKIVSGDKGGTLAGSKYCIDPNGDEALCPPSEVLPSSTPQASSVPKSITITPKARASHASSTQAESNKPGMNRTVGRHAAPEAGKPAFKPVSIQLQQGRVVWDVLENYQKSHYKGKHRADDISNAVAIVKKNQHVKRFDRLPIGYNVVITQAVDAALRG